MIKFNVYALNWNESRIIPAFLHHYRDAHRIIVFDNESTDDSVNLILNAGREVISFKSDNTFDDQINMDLKNSIWKDSTHENIDFVIVQDMDEFIYFPYHPDNISMALVEYKSNGITCAECIGYNMVCTDEKWDSLLSKLNSTTGISDGLPKLDNYDNAQISAVQTVNRGYRFSNEDKVLLFNPHEILETQYSPGAHTWNPVCNVVYPKDPPALLHYKYIGKFYCQRMIADKRDRLSSRNKTNMWGLEYLISDAEISDNLSGLEEMNRIRITKNVHEYYARCKNFKTILTTIITLERDVTRVSNIQDNCIPFVINYRIQPAIDGSKYHDLSDFCIENNITIDQEYLQAALVGALACSCSHMQAWEYQIKNNIHHMIVLEDDVMLDRDFLKDSSNVFSEVDPEFDLVYLYVYPDHYKNTDEVHIEGKQFANQGYKTWCTVAYLLSLKGAKKLWDHVRQNISDNVDNMIGNMIESKSLHAYSAKKQFVKCIGQAVPWDDDPAKLKSNIWSSESIRDILQTADLFKRAL